jgi:serine/threonine protein kinase
MDWKNHTFYHHIPTFTCVIMHHTIIFWCRGYLAPEYRDHSETTLACDIYSLGAIIIQLVTGCTDIPNEHKVRVISLTF